MNIIILNPSGKMRRFYADLDRSGKEFVMAERLSASLLASPASIVIAPCQSGADVRRIQEIFKRTNIEHFLIALKDENEGTPAEQSSALAVRMLKAGADRCPEDGVNTITPAELIEYIDGIERFSTYLLGRSIFAGFNNSVLQYAPNTQSLSIQGHEQPFALTPLNGRLLRYLFNNAEEYCSKADIERVLLSERPTTKEAYDSEVIQFRIFEIRKTINDALDAARSASPTLKQRLGTVCAKDILRSKRGHGYGVFDPIAAAPQEL